mmetsp:Transcript_12656/g.19033  ORF Transcript_12656/g.19033 Transcript_12656/m.19033 type:complete len:412 (+) Transcript_12656:86-1321(+)
MKACATYVLAPIILWFSVSVAASTAVLEEKELVCFSYGCPQLPEDLIEEDVQIKMGYSDDPSATAALLDTSNGPIRSATLTLTGYKGGKLADQINQDRALIVAPFHELNNWSSSSEDNEGDDSSKNILMGVFDGHSKGGEKVSQFVIEELPKRLADGLSDIAATNKGEYKEQSVRDLLNQTFVELDRDVPVGENGGCTASVLLKLGPKLYVANAGDSQTFVAIFNSATNESEVVYITREDKPNLPDEKKRVESMGGTVYIPPPEKPNASSRVVIYDYKTGYRSGLAMSRSIGDRAFGKRGVIPDPLIEVLDLNDLMNKYGTEECEFDEFDENSEEVCVMNADEFKVYVVSGTDGMMDEVTVEEITSLTGPKLYADDGNDILNALGTLIVSSAQRWGSRYRDDIAITVARIA